MGRSPQSSQGRKVWEHPKKSGIKIRERQNPGGSIGYRVTIPTKITGKTNLLVKQFKEKIAAYTWAETELIKYQNQGRNAQNLSLQERLQAHEALSVLSPHGLALDEAARNYIKILGRLREAELSIEEVIDFAITRLRPAGGAKTFSEIVRELVKIKEGCDLRERSRQDFESRAKRIEAHFGTRQLSQMTAQELTTWLLSLGLSARSRKNYLAVAGEIFRHAVSKKYLTENPLSELTKVEKKAVIGADRDGAEPSILSVPQAGKLIRTAAEHPELRMLAPVTLALFCGIRTEELKRMDWGEIRLEESEPFVVIPKAKAKKRRIRHVAISPNAAEWLSLCRARAGSVADDRYLSDFQKRFKKLQRLAEFGIEEEKNGKRIWRSTWQTNCMRHSFGTYHFALHGDSMLTARLLGHKATDDVLFDHYRALATKDEGTAFFQILPKNG